MKYEDHDIDNFITDEFFIQWIKNPNENSSHFWEKWIELHPEKRDLVNEAANLIRSVKYADKFEFSDKMYIETFENILKVDDIQCPERLPLIFKKSAPNNASLLSSIFPFKTFAASLLILFCIWMQFEAFNYSPEKPFIPEVTLIKRSNPVGQKSIISLPDGSKIHLNSKSEIEFPEKFSEDTRLVTLTGEAFFEIEKEKRPFIVQTGNTKINVLGTSFNVKKKENESLYVALVTGKVTVNTENGSQMILEPNEMLVLEKDGKFRKSYFDPKEIIGWKDNFLVFKSSKLPEIKNILEQWYGVEINIKGNYDKNWTYSGIYQDEMLENVLRGICMTSGMSFKIESKKVTLTNPK